MDVDPTNSLKRCSSAPQINNILPGQQTNCPVIQNSTTINVSSRDIPMPTSFTAILTPRTRRFSTSFSPMNGSPSSKLVPRISQIRQEECIEIANAREVNHEREVHSTMLISQSYEDLTLITEGWSFKSDHENSVSNPLHLNISNSNPCCSSPSPTRSGLRLPYGLSPSPTRKSFATRRSMSPIAMRPSQLANSVKRKFELDDPSSTSSPPPFKKIFIDRNPSPSFRQTPSPLCPSPDSCASYEGRITPKLFISKLFTNSQIANSVSSSPAPTELSSETDTPSEMDCGSDNNQTPPQSNKTPPTSSSITVTEESSMESGGSAVLTSSGFKEPDKCDITVSSTDNNSSNSSDRKEFVVPCDSTTTTDKATINNEKRNDKTTRGKQEENEDDIVEKMKIDEPNCG